MAKGHLGFHNLSYPTKRRVGRSEVGAATTLHKRTNATGAITRPISPITLAFTGNGTEATYAAIFAYRISQCARRFQIQQFSTEGDSRDKDYVRNGIPYC